MCQILFTWPALAAVCRTVSPPEDTTKGAPFSKRRIRPACETLISKRANEIISWVGGLGNPGDVRTDGPKFPAHKVAKTIQSRFRIIEMTEISTLETIV